jgi:hypothetical protein
MPSAGFEPATPATKRPQTYALDSAATEVGSKRLYGVTSISQNAAILYSKIKGNQIGEHMGEMMKVPQSLVGKCGGENTVKEVSVDVRIVLR